MFRKLLVVAVCIGMLMYATGIAWAGAGDPVKTQTQSQDQTQTQAQDQTQTQLCNRECDPDCEYMFYQWYFNWLWGGPDHDLDD